MPLRYVHCVLHFVVKKICDFTLNARPFGTENCCRRSHLGRSDDSNLVSIHLSKKGKLVFNVNRPSIRNSHRAALAHQLTNSLTDVSFAEVLETRKSPHI